jgi:phosphatidylinositol glycan class K
MLFMIDTCQANTMYSKFYSPNILATGSSEFNQSSYSHHSDNDVGVAVIDRYTYYNLEYLENNVKNASSKHTMKDLFDSYDRTKIHSDPGVRTDLFRRNLDEVLITDFFGNVQNVEVDGQGDENKWKTDVSELARLAANITFPGSSSKTLAKTSEVTKISRSLGAATRKVSAFKVEGKASWTQSVIGVCAVALCSAAWFGGSFFPKY